MNENYSFLNCAREEFIKTSVAATIAVICATGAYFSFAQARNLYNEKHALATHRETCSDLANRLTVMHHGPCPVIENDTLELIRLQQRRYTTAGIGCGLLGCAGLYRLVRSLGSGISELSKSRQGRKSN